MRQNFPKLFLIVPSVCSTVVNSLQQIHIWMEFRTPEKTRIIYGFIYHLLKSRQWLGSYFPNKITSHKKVIDLRGKQFHSHSHSRDSLRLESRGRCFHQRHDDYRPAHAHLFTADLRFYDDFRSEKRTQHVAVVHERNASRIWLAGNRRFVWHLS